jgi:hypothetical protein
MRRPEFEHGYNAIVGTLDSFTDEEREELLKRLLWRYCKGCGGIQRGGIQCQCENDD